jgi:hypothetical protein
MIKPEQIPNEVVEAAAYKYLFYCPRLKTHDEAIRAAIAAALNAWPESYSLAENDSAVIRDVAAVILRLPIEE